MAVEVTDERIAAAADRLHEGGWFFTPRQLYYAVCADVETAPVKIASSEVGLGLVLILVAVIIANRVVLAVLGGLGAVIVLVGVVTHLQERRPPPLARLLVMSFPAFEARLAAMGFAHPGLIDVDAVAVPGATAGAVVVCDRPEVAAIIVSNMDRIGNIAVRLGAEDGAPPRADRAVVIHDCDPTGCALAADLRDAGVEVADVGINPGELLGRRIQVIEGAPARLPRDLTAHLSAEEMDWLRGGRRLEVATLSPEEVVLRVRAGAPREGNTPGEDRRG